MRSDKTLKKWYRYVNKKFFDNELPDDTCVRWADEDEDGEGFEERYFGVADKIDGKYIIIMSRELNKPFVVRMSTLIHEMLHVKTELRDNHGESFNNQLNKLIDKGLFKKGAIKEGITLF